MMDYLPLFMFAIVCGTLLMGYPVAFSLAGSALFCAFIGILTGTFDPSFLTALPNRTFSIMTNQTLLAVPLFVMMGVTLERSKIAEALLDTMAALFDRVTGGLAVSVILVGALLAASTGIVGATVVTMGLLSLPTLLKRGYPAPFATGTLCATGTLGQIIPPSIALVLLGDVLSNAYQQAQLNQGIFNPKSVSVGDLFVGAAVPGLILIGCYLAYVLVKSALCKTHLKAHTADSSTRRVTIKQVCQSLFPPLLLIALVLGSILTGKATTTEAAAVGAMGAMLLALIKGRLNIDELRYITAETATVSSMVFMILIGAAVFSLVFRGFGGEALVHDLFSQMPGGVIGATFTVMLVIFLLGFILDFIEITFVVIPLVGPVLLSMGLDPIWLGVMIALNLQTSFLTPPFGFALFYLRGVASEHVATTDIYKGVVPFIIIQLFVMLLIAIYPELATWLPSVVYG